MSLPKIARLARAEKKSEALKQAAETNWRSDWWATTLELAVPDDSAKKEIGEMYDEIESILGQTTSWLSRRRRTGKAFVALAQNEAETLPPRKAMVVTEQKIEVTAEVIEMLRESEREEESLREFSARLTGKAWSVGSDAEIEKALEAKPALAAKVAAKAVKTDEGRKAVAKAMVEDPEAMTEVKRAEVEAYTRTPAAKNAAQTAKEKAAEEARQQKEMLASGALTLSALFPLVMASKEVQEFLDTAEKVDYRADEETKDALRKIAVRFTNYATILTEIADGSVSTTITDEALEALLGAS